MDSPSQDPNIDEMFSWATSAKKHVKATLKRHQEELVKEKANKEIAIKVSKDNHPRLNKHIDAVNTYERLIVLHNTRLQEIERQRTTLEDALVVIGLELRLPEHLRNMEPHHATINTIFQDIRSKKLEYGKATMALLIKMDPTRAAAAV